MTLLIRSIQNVSSWTKALDGSYDPASDALPPIAIVREFIPSERDGTGLSFFEVAGEDEACVIASAFAYDKEKIDSGTYLFACVRREVLLASGLTLNVSPGKLYHKFSDERHVEIEVANLDTSITLARLFFVGDVFSFEGRLVGRISRQQARVDQFQYNHLFGSTFANNWKAKNLLRFISDNCVTVAGNGLEADRRSPV